MDRLTGLEVFVQSVRHGGISAAARRLHMSPTMAARHLSALEERLGARLLNRTTRKLSLTDAGAGFLPRAERILEELAEAEAEAARSTATVSGTLRLSAPTAFGMRHIVPLLAGFTERFPAVTVDLGLDDHFVDLVADGWDMAIRIGQLSDSTLVARKLAPAHMCITAAPAYLALHGTPKTCEDLADHACLSYSLTSHTRPGFWPLGTKGEISHPVKGPLVANNGRALAMAAMDGMGLLLGPRFLVDDALKDGRLKEIIIDTPLPEMGAIYAITHAARAPAAKTRAFIDYLKKAFAPYTEAW